MCVIKDESWRLWYRNKNQFFKGIITLPLLIINFINWLKYFKKSKPDLIHFNVSRTIIPLIAAKFLDIKTIIHFREIPSIIRYKFILGWSNYYCIMNFAKNWIANSNATLIDIKEKNKYGKIHLVHNFIDLNDFDNRFKINIKNPFRHGFKYNIAMIGGINPWKNQMEFVKSAIKVLNERTDIGFYLFGSIISKTYYDDIIKIIKMHNHEKNIIYAGFNNNIPSVLKVLVIVVHTMPNESFGRVYIEAMSAKIPVITYNSGGAKDIVLNGETGILVKPNDFGLLADSINSLIANTSLRNGMGIKSRKHVEENFSFRPHMEKINKIYSEIIFK